MFKKIMMKIRGLSGDWAGDGTLLDVGGTEQTANNEACWQVFYSFKYTKEWNPIKKEEMEIKNLGKWA